MKPSRFSFFVFRYKFLAAALLIAVAAAWPLLTGDGLLNTRGGGDSPFLLQRLHQLETAVRDGHFPARWMPDANYGYGYPFFNFYAPLSIYVAAVFRFIGFSFVSAIKLAQLAGFLTAAAGAFALARRWFQDEWAALLASAAYTLAPFHLVNVYVRGDSLAEFWAMAFYPLVILAADNVAGGRPSLRAGEMARNVGLLALAYAGLILSHNISALIFTPFLLLYILLRWIRPPFTIHNSQFTIHYFAIPQKSPRAVRIGNSNSRYTLQAWFGNWNSRTSYHSQFTIHYFLSSLAAIFLALALSAWFFLPALAEKSLVQLGPVTEGYFSFNRHFLGTAAMPLAQTSFLFNFDVSALQAFSMGLAQAAAAAAGLIALFISRKRLSLAPLFFIWITFLTATFMLAPLSRPLWQRLPLLEFTQFPWRFLSAQAFAGAMAVGSLGLFRRQKWVVTVVTAALLITSLGQLRPDFLPLNDADVTAERLAQYEWLTGNIGTTVSAEYLPHTVQPRPYTSPWLNRGQRDAAVVLSGDVAQISATERKTARQTWQVTAVTPATLILPTLHWPGWQATIDGELAAIRPSTGGGLIELDVPPGDHTINLRLARTPAQLAAELLSLLAALAAAWLLRPSRWPDARLSGAAVGGLLLLIALARLWPERPLPDLRTWDLGQLGYLHHAKQGVPFNDGAQLADVTLDQSSVRPGDTLVVELDWETPPRQPVTVALASPAAVWTSYQPSPPTLASQTQTAAAAQIFELPIPENAPAGLFAPTVSLADGRALTPSGQTRGELLLAPIRVIAASSQVMLRHPLDATAVNVWQPDETTLAVELAWATQQPISQNYNAHLELVDSQNQVVAWMDAPPGYGFLPSSGWRDGRWLNDWLTLALPAPLPGRPPYALMASLVDVSAKQPVMTRRLGELRPGADGLVFARYVPSFALPEDVAGGTAVFSQDGRPLIQLMGYRWEQKDGALNVTLFWQALADGGIDYTRFVHLAAADNPTPLAQDDGFPGPNFPTGQWVRGQMIADSVRLDVTAVPPGSYRLAVGFYQNLGDRWPRLTAVAADGSFYPDNRALLPLALIKTGSD